MAIEQTDLTLDDRLCFSLYGAAMAVNRAYKPLLDELGITYPQYLVLAALWEKDGLAIGEIAERLALEPSTITPLAKRMEVSGLLTRRRNPENERQVVVSLTKAGGAMREQSRCLGETLLAASGLSIERLRKLNEEVRSFRDAIAASTSPRIPAP